jgi:hypothetical protein
MNATLEFSGAGAASITTNGSTAGVLTLHIAKTAGTVVTLTDNWNNTTGVFSFVSGALNLSGRTVNSGGFSSGSGGTRALDISNATINCINYWDYRGAGKTLIANGSHLSSGGGFGSDGLNYPWVDITGTNGIGIGFPISGTNFGQLTFTNNDPASSVFLGLSNTVRRLEFKGKGNISTGCIIDSLILAGSRVYAISNTTINKYIKAESDPCSGLLEMRGAPGTITFGTGAEIHLNNIYMQNIKAAGPMTPIAFNGADAGGNSGWTINIATGGNRYWVGGSGDWSNPAHWSATSGGTGGTACVPTVYDDVYFDAGSGFTSASKTVTVNSGNAYCRNIKFTGAVNNPIFNKAASFEWEVWGDSVVLNPATTLNISWMTIKGNNQTFLKGAAPAGNFDIRIDKAGGSLTMLNDYSNSTSAIQLLNGAFIAAGRNLTIESMDNTSLANATSIDISNATINTGYWRYDGVVTNHALNATNSVITSTQFLVNGLTYNKVNVTGNAITNTEINNIIIDSLNFTSTNPAAQAGIRGANNNLNIVEFKGGGGIYGTNNIIDTLIFFPGSTYTLNANTNTTITGEWYGSGTPCRPTEILSSSSSANATVTKNTGTVSFDYIRLRRITAAGAAQPFIAYDHTNDLGGNSNWNIAPYNGAAPILGLGSDTALRLSEFPYTINTDGFFASPSATYLWNDNSTADTLKITGPGTYSVRVSLADGCSIDDEIVVTENTTLPITLISFTANLQHNCSAVKLNWSSAGEQNSEAYIIQRSNNGSTWVNIGTVAAAGNSNEQRRYSFTDENLNGSNQFIYRLLMKDIDGRQKNSSMVTVKLDCGTSKFYIYPNPVRNAISVQTPAGGGQKTLSVFSENGMRIVQRSLQPGTVQTISAAAWTKGLYYIVITENGQQVYAEKIVKQ